VRSILSALAVSFVFAASAGQAATACSLSGSSFQFDNFPIVRDQMTNALRDQLAEIGAKARAENCSLTVTAVAPRQANKEAFNVRFRQSYVARQALAWRSGTSARRTAAMETIARFDVKAQLGRYSAGSIYINVD
jgi:hypothetical protein